MQKLNSVALGCAGAWIAGITMLLLGIFGNLGVYEGAVNAMMQWHVFFSLSILGIIAGIIEASVFTFIGFWLFGRFYNRYAE